MRNSRPLLALAFALALLNTTAAAQTINDVQQRPGNTQPWGAVTNATGSQDVSQYNTSVGSNPTVDAFRFLQGSSAPSATPLFTMSTGGMVAGIATGSRQGAGTINAQGYFINGAALTGAPSGSAGGDLSGTYPNPTVARVAGTTPVAGCVTWLGTPSSANLRGCLTDESGTGLAYFQGGDLGTPSAGVLTNASGTAASLVAGNATKLSTPRAIGIAGSTGLTATGVNFDGSAAINPALTGTLIVANGGTGDTGTAWTTYTPSTACTAGAGTWTTNSARSKSIGKTVFFELDATLTAVGTCSGTQWQFTLPAIAQSAGGGVGRETAVIGYNTVCSVSASSQTLVCSIFTGNTFASSQRYVLSGVYESQ